MIRGHITNNASMGIQQERALSYQGRLHQTKVSGTGSWFSEGSFCQTCHSTVGQFEVSAPFSPPDRESSVLSAVRRERLCWAGGEIWRSGWWLGTKGMVGEMDVSLAGLKLGNGEQLSILFIGKGHAGHPVLCVKLSELIAPDWLQWEWCKDESRCLCSLWSWGPLLLRDTGRWGLDSKTPNDVCVGLTGSLLLPWWQLSPSDDPNESHSDASSREPEKSHLLKPSINFTSQGHLEQHFLFF